MNYRISIAYLSILSGVLSIACLLVGAIAVNYNFEAFSDPILILEYASQFKAAYWFNILDMFGYYILLLPLVFYFDQQYRFRTPWLSLITNCGLCYVLIGAIGAITLAVAWPLLMQDYLHASAIEIENIVLMTSVLTTIVTKGLWNILEALFASVWFIGVGRLLFNNQKITGIIAVVTGIATLIDALGNVFELKMLAEIGLNIYLIGSIVFMLTFGSGLMKKTKTEHIELRSHNKEVSN
ncbi:hypothetical protein SAMN05421820_11562 [Pedobacter steynii]|uniref:DUF4386 domain-containing protein n=1 Tax=Pedobacter steynii TaxID=430522 RepID=A0A1H0JT76_9SPHI|nr:hypothetical protein [Pedobacter steynii]NQX43151.1 hypothetical protein [Pedobacter steynii]SDO46672.1 hypothetical protein SAMN05421820_11562 [Pedobacter steynii]